MPAPPAQGLLLSKGAREIVHGGGDAIQVGNLHDHSRLQGAHADIGHRCLVPCAGGGALAADMRDNPLHPPVLALPNVAPQAAR
jgi:hypothetical protein